jgi:hypothetical protein
VFANRDQVLFFDGRLLIFDDEQRFPRTLAPKSTTPSIFEISASWPPRLEQLRYARQTASDVLHLGCLRGVLANNAPGTVLSPSPTITCARTESGNSPQARLCHENDHLWMQVFLNST